MKNKNDIKVYLSFHARGIHEYVKDDNHNEIY